MPNQDLWAIDVKDSLGNNDTSEPLAPQSAQRSSPGTARNSFMNLSDRSGCDPAESILWVEAGFHVSFGVLRTVCIVLTHQPVAQGYYRFLDFER